MNRKICPHVIPIILSTNLHSKLFSSSPQRELLSPITSSITALTIERECLSQTQLFVLSCLNRPEWLFGWLKQLGKNNWGWDTHSLSMVSAVNAVCVSDDPSAHFFQLRLTPLEENGHNNNKSLRSHFLLWHVYGLLTPPSSTQFFSGAQGGLLDTRWISFPSSPRHWPLESWFLFLMQAWSSLENFKSWLVPT